MDLSKLKARKAEERNCYTDHAQGHKCWEGSCFRRGFHAGWEECEELYRPLLDAVEFYAKRHWASEGIYPSPDKARAALESLRKAGE